LATDGTGEVEVVKTAAANQSPLWMPDGKHLTFVSNSSGKFDLWSVALQDGASIGSPSLVKRDVGDIRPIGMTRSGSYYYTQRKVGIEQVSIAELDSHGGSRIIESFAGMNPLWSPDGKSLAFKRHSAKGDNQDLVIRSLETGEERAYVQNAVPIGATVGAWLHDGKSLFQILNGADPPQSISIYLVDRQTGAARSVLTPERTLLTGLSSTPADSFRPSVFYSLSPDDKTLYFGAQNNGTFDRIVSVELAGGRPSTVFMLPGAADTLPKPGRLAMKLSPDGRTLAFTIINAKTQEGRMARVQTDGGNYREILSPFPSISFQAALKLAWTPDGKAILFAIPVPGSPRDFQIMRIGVNGGKPEYTGLTVRALSAFDASPIGSRIAFSTDAGNSESDLFAIDNLPALLKRSN
jgi:Tol biopolymer transport system component